MSITEVFTNPTVKQVIFQIRFPNLFFIEDKIGDFQLKIMDKFPESALLFKKQLLFADIGPETKMENILDQNPDMARKIWQFSSPKGYKLSVQSDTLDITSTIHKTYKNPSSDHKFRDFIEFVLDRFFEITKIPSVTRIGLRYIDHCPVPEKETITFQTYYNSTFPLSRFKIEEAQSMKFVAIVSRDDCFIRYVESLKQVEDKYILILDFDAFANNTTATEVLTTTDKLHDIISQEYELTIKEPVYRYMRGE
jgi:uncharacterized protein (TIGR04255 family)